VCWLTLTGFLSTTTRFDNRALDQEHTAREMVKFIAHTTPIGPPDGSCQGNTRQHWPKFLHAVPGQDKRAILRCQCSWMRNRKVRSQKGPLTGSRMHVQCIHRISRTRFPSEQSSSLGNKQATQFVSCVTGCSTLRLRGGSSSLFFSCDP
jgi:hypothetical protein